MYLSGKGGREGGRGEILSTDSSQQREREKRMTDREGGREGGRESVPAMSSALP